MTEQLEQDTEFRNVCEQIGGTAEGAYELLIERREAALTAAIQPLDAEKETLIKEFRAIEEASADLAKILPTRAREAQREADRLLLEGKHEEAETKMQEAQEAANAPATMTERQREISSRLEAIDAERKVAAKRIFEQWYSELQQVIRASEHGLFIELLDKSRDEMYSFQERHGLGGTLQQPFGFLIKDFHLSGLTAAERSEEWTSGNRWYKGRQ